MKVKVAQLCPTLCNPMDYTYSPWDYPGQDTGVGSLSLLQKIFWASNWASPKLLMDSLPAIFTNFTNSLPTFP